jgi:hypothetical protein
MSVVLNVIQIRLWEYNTQIPPILIYIIVQICNMVVLTFITRLTMKPRKKLHMNTLIYLNLQK